MLKVINVSCNEISIEIPFELYSETTRAFSAENITTKKVVEYFPALTRWGNASLVSR